MTERERWIVYPLLFFALGASIRDKLFKHVASKEVMCERLIADEIICNTLGQFASLQAGEVNTQAVRVRDPENPQLRLVEIGAAVQRNNPNGKLGLLVLRDNQGREICGVTNDSLYVKSVVCEDASVVASLQNNQPLIQLGSRKARDQRTGKTGVLGIVSINNQSYLGAPGQRFTPLPKPGAAQPQAEPNAEEGTKEPVKESLDPIAPAESDAEKAAPDSQ